MTPLVPEKRTDRNGRLVTRHVRSGQQPQKGTVPIPAPVSPAGTIPSDTGRVRLRPKQVEQKDFSFARAYMPPSEALGYAGQVYPSKVEFKASEAEAYGVLSVTSEADALRLLRNGCRSAEEAEDHLLKYRGDVLDRRELTDELLRRNVSAKAMIEARLDGGFPTRRAYSVKEQADAIELFAITALRTRDIYIDVLDEVLDGKIRVEDIKAIGATRLKTGSRLAASKELLEALATGDPKFTVEDVRWALDESAPEGNRISSKTSAAGLYDLLAFCLLHGGRDLLDRFEQPLVHHVYQSLGFLDRGRGPERYAALAYGLEARAGTALERDSAIRAVEALDDLRLAGVPAKPAGEMVASGLNAEQALALYRGETNGPVADGWL